MDQETAKLFYVISCIALGVIIFSPTLFSVIGLPKGESYSALWLLDSDHQIENGTLVISPTKLYKVYLGVENHMRNLEYYRIYVKLRQNNEALPDEATESPSPLEPIFEYRVFLNDNETWERESRFSIEEISFSGDFAQISGLSIDGNYLSVNEFVAREEQSNDFYCQFIFELWLLNSTTSRFQYHNRFVSLWLRLTDT
jgi:hypothetical protein